MYDYTKNLRWSRFKVGIVVSIAFIILIITVIFAANLGDLFASRTTLYADFADVRGLKTGAPVWLSGVQIGKVDSMYFMSANTVRVEISINKDYLKFIKKDSTATVNTLGLLGDKFLVLSQGTDGALEPGGVIKGTAPPGLPKLTEAGSTAIEKFQELEQRLDHIAWLIENGEGSASRFIKDPSLYNNLDQSSKKLAAILDSVEKGQGTLGGIIRDKSLYENMNASSIKLNAILDRIEKGQGAMGELTQNGALSRDIQQTVNDLRWLIEDIKKNPKKYFKVSIF